MSRNRIPRWKVVYDLFRPAQPGDTIPWDRIGETLQLDPDDDTDRSKILTAVRRAAAELREEDLKSARGVRGVGVMILLPDQRIERARKLQTVAQRKIEDASDEVTLVDFGTLEPSQRTAFEVIGRALQHQQEMMTWLNLRQSDLESAVDKVKGQTQLNTAQVDELTTRVRELEQRIADRAQAESTATFQSPGQ